MIAPPTVLTTVPRAAAAALAAALLLLAGPALAQPKAQQQPAPDWPCAQRKTPHLSLGAVWSGPDLASAGPWTSDQDAATLAQTLASRRTPLDQAGGLVDAFAREAGAEARTRLVRVFAGVFEIVDSERDRVMHGIERYARGQNLLAERLRDESDKLSAVRDAMDAAETAETRELEQKLAWDTRIFDERARSLTYVCETPVLLEQRVFEIGRLIGEKL